MKKVYRRKNRSVSLLFAHMVFCSKYRRKVFTPAVFTRLRKSFERTARMLEKSLLEIDLLAVEADRDHVHLMISFPPRLALSTIVQRLKCAASRDVRAQKYPEIRRALWGAHFWSASYFVVSCGGAPLEVVKSYVENQNSPDRRRKAAGDRKTGDRKTGAEKKQKTPPRPSPDGEARTRKRTTESKPPLPSNELMGLRA